MNTHPGTGSTLATRCVWSIARGAAWLFYRVERIGPPPPEGPLLLVANHSNGLLDPAIVVATSHRLPRFLAKSTLFSGAPYSFLVRWSGAIPVYRRQDSGVDPAKNVEMFGAVGGALASGDAVCLFPEGISHSTGRLGPLKTGAARVVLSAEAAGTAVSIVAVGLNFSDKGVFQSPALVAYGPAFTGGDLLRAGDPLAPEAVDALTDRIADHIRDVVVEAAPVTDADLVERVEQLYARAMDLSPEPADRLARERLIARGLDRLRTEDPARLATIVDALRRHARRLERFGLARIPLGRGRGRWTDAVPFIAREAPIAVVLLPVALLATVVFALPYRVVDAIATRRRVTHDIQATVKVLGGTLVHGLWVAFLAVFAWWMAGRPAAALLAAVFLPLLGVAGVFALEREGAAWTTVRTWLALRRTSAATHRRLRRAEQALAAVLDETHAWMTTRVPEGVPASDAGPIG